MLFILYLSIGIISLSFHCLKVSFHAKSTLFRWYFTVLLKTVSSSINLVKKDILCSTNLSDLTENSTFQTFTAIARKKNQVFHVLDVDLILTMSYFPDNSVMFSSYLIPVICHLCELSSSKLFRWSCICTGKVLVTL